MTISTRQLTSKSDAMIARILACFLVKGDLPFAILRNRVYISRRVIHAVASWIVGYNMLSKDASSLLIKECTETPK